MGTWQLQDAKARLSEVIATANKQGPQVITQRGVETAVVVPIAEWRNRKQDSHEVGATAEQRRARLLAFLQSAPDFEVPDRHKERLERKRKAR